MPRDPEKLLRRFQRLNRKPRTRRYTAPEIAVLFGAASPSDVAFVDNVPTVGGAPILLPMTNPTDGSGYTDVGAVPLFAPTGPSIHDVMQGSVADCYFLSPLAGLAHFQPATIPPQITRVGAKARTRWNASGTDTWLEQDTLLPDNAAHVTGCTWVSQYEKGYAYWRTKANTYASLNGGNPIMPLRDLGWSSIGYNPGASAWAAAASALSKSLPAFILTKTAVAPGVPLVGWHAYTIISVNPDGSLVCYNPWGVDGVGDGSNPDDGVVTITKAQAEANLTYVVVCTTYVPPVALPAPAPTPPPVIPMPNPMPPAVPVSPTPTPVPEPAMKPTVAISAARTTAAPWDRIDFVWGTENAASATINGQPVALHGTASLPMPSNDLTLTLVATGIDGQTATESVTVKLATPTAPTPPVAPTTPTSDPIVSIIVTRKSGKQEVIAG